MLILLPPSEGKAERRRGRPYEPDGLSFPELSAARVEVAAALTSACARPDAAAVLGLPPTLSDQVQRNLRLTSAPAMPARDLYTGVLFDRLDLPSLDAGSKRRALRRVVVTSGLFGALRLGDRVPPYRCAMGVTLRGTGRLASFWRPHLDPVLTRAADDGLVVDCRSSDYVAAWRPGPGLRDRWVQVVVPGASHFAKYTRGAVARSLVELTTPPRTAQGLADALSGAHDMELVATASGAWELRVQPEHAG